MNSKWLRTFRKKRRLALENEVQDQKRPRYSSPSNVPEEMPSLVELDPNLIQDPSSEKAHQGGSSNVSRNQNEACLVADQGVSSEIASSSAHPLSLQYHCLMVAKKSVIIITDNEISLISIFRYYY